MKYDEIGEWSEIKLAIIKEYAGAYTTILSKKSWCKGYVYIDAFAGAGQHISKATGEFISGSPLNALLVKPAFTEYHYIDLDSEKIDELARQTADVPNVHLYRGNCNEKLTVDIFPAFGYTAFKRALCLLDPYGLDLDWKTVEMAGKQNTIDIFINFSVMDMNRNVLPRDLSKAKPSDLERMNSFWGDESWKKVLYREQPDLFGDTHLIREQDFRVLALEYRKRLKNVAGFRFVPQPILMRNTKGGPLYYLFFASPQEVAGDIVRQIFDKYSKGSSL
jgi:three-Cys-motif partner protein